MSTFRNPVGPQSSTVYWRRRLVVGLGLLAVLIIIILIIVRPGSGAPGTAATTPPASATPTPTPTTSSTPQTAGAACVPGNIKLEAVTDKVSYKAGELPQLSMKITNTGAATCTMNLGSTQQELKITSGTEQIWDSKDCQTGAVDASTTLKPGVPLSTPPIAWDRTRSSAATCSANRPAVTAGGASYHLGVKVGNITSAATVQFLLY
ncbi:MAG: hypothetical protein ACYCZY_09985 [Lacisediminihabitans sp.]